MLDIHYTIFIIHNGSNIYLLVLSVNWTTFYLIGTSLPAIHIPFSALFLSLDVLHPSTSSANSTPSTNSSHPTQGWYQPFLYLLCAIQGALSLLFSLDVPSSQHTKSQFKPPNTRTIPCTPLSGISFFCSSGCFTSWGTPFSHTPQCLEFILFTESPNSCDSPLMCVKRVLTKFFTSRRPQNA